MNRFLSMALHMFSRTGTGHTPRRRSSVKPQLEFLECREVPSVASASPHGDVSTPYSDGAERIFFIVNKNAVTEDTPTPGLYFNNLDQDGFSDPVLLNGNGKGPQSVVSISAGLGSNGDDDVFAEASNGSLWRYTVGLSGWKEILGPNQTVSFAAVNDGEVFAIDADHSLYLYSGTSWSEVPTPNTVRALDAVTNKYGYNTVYVLNGDDTFGEVSYELVSRLPGPTAVRGKVTDDFVGIGIGGSSDLAPVYTELAPAQVIRFRTRVETSPIVTSFSAGLDSNGYAEVYATFWTGNLYQNIGNTSTGWTVFAPSGSFQDYSAVDQGQVWILSNTGTGTGAATLFTESGKPATYSVNGVNYEAQITGPFTSLSGVVANGPYTWSVFTGDTNGNIDFYGYDSVPGLPFRASS
jgi:hypothetical protein